MRFPVLFLPFSAALISLANGQGSSSASATVLTGTSGPETVTVVSLGITPSASSPTAPTATARHTAVVDSAGFKAGMAVMAVVLAAIIAAAIFFVVRRRRSTAQDQQKLQPPPVHEMEGSKPLIRDRSPSLKGVKREETHISTAASELATEKNPPQPAVEMPTEHNLTEKERVVQSDEQAAAGHNDDSRDS